MRNNTQKIFECLIKGSFLSVDSTDFETKHLYDDVEENFSDYEAYFKEIGFQLEMGDGYFYFSRMGESKLQMDKKLQGLAQWVDILDFLKTYDIAFSVGYQFREAQISERISVDVELRDKARKLFQKQKTNYDVVRKLAEELQNKGFAELVSEQEGTYKVTSAFRYVEEMVNIITIYNEEDIPEV